ncbi:hypothetical protein VTH06DRAFT_2779 [Thermothelomyces fergusii]
MSRLVKRSRFLGNEG